MPDIHIDRHGDRWAVRDSPDATPIFESYTLAEAESEARRRADGGRVVVSGGEEAPQGSGQHTVEPGREPEPHEVRQRSTGGDPGEFVREQQGGL